MNYWQYLTENRENNWFLYILRIVFENIYKFLFFKENKLKTIEIVCKIPILSILLN